MRNYFISLTFILACAGQQLCAQNKKIDSLLSLLKTDIPDTNKLNHLNNLSREYKEIGSFDKALFYANAVLQLSNELLEKVIPPGVKQTILKCEAKAYNNSGIVYMNQGNYPEALKNYFVCLKISQEINDKKSIASAYNNIGNVYYSQGNYPEALKNHFACLKIREEMDDKKGIATSYNNIGLVYYLQGNYPEALKNHLASLKIMEEIGDKKGLASSYNNIGIVYYTQGNYQEALKNELASLEMRETLGDKSGIATSYGSIGNVYYDLGNYPEALRYFFASIKIYEAFGNKAGIASSYVNIGNVLTRQMKYTEAKDYLIKAKVLSEKIGFKDNLRNTFKGLTCLDSATGNFKGAYENHKLFILYRDSLDNEGTRKKTIQSQMTFDFEKKEAVANAEHKKELENQSALADEKSRKQKIVIGFVMCGLLLVVVFAGFILRSLRITRKQKKLIELQKNVVEEHQKEILDSIYYARRIQTSLLPTEKYIERSLKRLEK